MKTYDYPTGDEMLSAIESANQEMSGLAPAEVVDKFGYRDIGGLLLVSGVITSIRDYAVQSAGTASQVVSEYIAAGGPIVDGTSALAPNPEVLTNLTLIYGGGGAVTAGGLLSLSTPVIVGIVAVVAGVAVVTYDIYNDNTVMDRIRAKISNWLFPDTDVAPVVVDSTGALYVDEDIVEAISEALGEEGVRTELRYTSSYESPYITGGVARSTPIYTNVAADAVSGGRPFPFTIRIPFLEEGESTFAILTYSKVIGTARKWVGIFATAIESELSEYWYDYTKNGKTVWYNYTVETTNRDVTINGPIEINEITVGDESALSQIVPDMAWDSVFNNNSDLSPEISGIIKFIGDTSSDSYIDVVTSISDSGVETDRYIKIRTPDADTPGISPNPADSPDPDTPATPPEITPYTNPEVKPTQYPPEVEVPDKEHRTVPGADLPSSSENPDVVNPPSIDPSVEPAPEPDPEPAPDTPGSSGDSETPPIYDILPGQYSFIPPAGQSGMIHVYNPTASQFWSFAEWLWQTFASTDPLQPTIWSNPFDGVISAHEIYCTPSTDGEDNIRCGYLSCPVEAGLVRQRYVTINCGSMVIQEKFGNYLDYAPYTKCHLFLPFIGIVELNSDFIVGHGVNVQYNIDAYTGTCVAFVTVAKDEYENTVYEFEGDCSSELPLSGGSMAAITAARRSVRANFVAGIAGGIFAGLGGSIGGAISNFANALVTPYQTSAKSDVSHSGGFTGCAGAMSAKKPYLMVTRPIVKTVDEYSEMYGYATHEEVSLGGCHGFTKCRSVHVASSTATEDEKRMIEEQLMSGVFL